MAIQLGRFQRSRSAMNGTVSIAKSNGPMCRMYSSTTSLSSSTIMILRVVSKSRSSSQSGYSEASSPATRLCSRRNTVFRIVLPIVEFPCSRPTAKTESMRSSGALPRIVSITNRSS